MGVYDSNISFDLDPETQKKLVYGVAALLVVLAVAAIASYVSDALGQKPLELRFEKNPVKAGEATKLIVKVTNINKADAANVKISLVAREKTEFDTFPLNEKFNGEIELISAGTSREVTFMLNPIGGIIPGTYTFDAKATINGIDYTKEAVLKVEQ